MLTTLRIKNLALVPDLTLELEPGYNVITGETGAGKSIIIGALNLLLGERADRSLIRSGSDSCSVEGIFDVSRLTAPLAEFLAENGLEPIQDGQLLLKRSFTAAGTNRQFINGSPTTLALLARAGLWLVDMHGPHDHQSLLDPAQQLSILDAFGGLAARRADFAAAAARCVALETEKRALVIDEQTYAQQLDLLRHQVREISAARLQPGEEESVEQEYQRASNAARLVELGQEALNALSESEPSLASQLAAIGRSLHDLQRIDPGTADLTELHAPLASQSRELQNALSHYLDRLEINPARLRELEERVDLLQSLRRKYGRTVADVIAFGAEAARKLESLESRDAELARLQRELLAARETAWKTGLELSLERRKIIPKLTRAVVAQLRDLGFRQSQFDVALAQAGEEAFLPERHRTGIDTVEFQFAPNPGEPAKPLRAIASSGELARVMLALKTVLAAEDQIPVLVFDEVDANVGGETASAVGEKMLQIARSRQVLCITHLPAVAASANAHYVVNKQVREGRTLSEIRRIHRKERVDELARMLGGQTTAARKHAESLLAPPGA